MAIIQPIENGKIVEDTTKTTKKDTDKNAADKEMFLKLLVAEMQYQDPLEPTTNTDYVKELASFSQIEAVQAVQEQMTTIQANSLVGKYVILLTNNTASGNQEYISGKVDYVMTDEEGSMFLSVNEKLYSIDDLDSVCDEKYYNAVTGGQQFNIAVGVLPNYYELAISDEDKISACRKMLESMSDYEKQYVAKEDVEKLEKLEERLSELKKAAEGAEEE